MDEKDRDEIIQELLEGFPDRFVVTEKAIDVSTHEEYVNYVRNIDIQQYTEDDILKESEKLYDETVSTSAKKKIIAVLAETGTVKAYRELEKFFKHPEEDLKHWIGVALYECRMLLENSLGDNNVGIISTGLGGKGNRFRYIVVIGLSCVALHDEQKKIIEASFQHVCRHHDSKVEVVEFFDSYVIITLLVSMDVAVGIVIEEGIHASNEKTVCLYDRYFVTNVKQPTEEEIISYLKAPNKEING